jgi:predicted amidohydrolase
VSSGGKATFKAGLVQMCTGRDMARNIADATGFIRAAAGSGCHYVQTPEVTTLFETDRVRLFAETKPEDGHPALAQFSDLARELSIWLHIGSMGILVSPDKIANRSFLFSPQGEIAARYDKIHMFDVDLPGGESYRESRNYQAGERGVVVDLPWGGLGLTICYDIRFPYLYRALAKAGARFIAIPAAFTVPTGMAHWHTLIKARAIETQCFVLAAAQAGQHETGRATYGHSLIVSPWGDVLAEADATTPTVITADIDLAVLETARSRVPSLTHDRPFDIVVHSRIAGTGARE